MPRGCSFGMSAPVISSIFRFSPVLKRAHIPEAQAKLTKTSSGVTLRKIKCRKVKFIHQTDS